LGFYQVMEVKVSLKGNKNVKKRSSDYVLKHQGILY
jgi:hypothetical protein